MFAVKNLYLDDIAMLSHTSYRTMLGTVLAVPIYVLEGKKTAESRDSGKRLGGQHEPGGLWELDQERL